MIIEFENLISGEIKNIDVSRVRAFMHDSAGVLVMNMNSGFTHTTKCNTVVWEILQSHIRSPVEGKFFDGTFSLLEEHGRPVTCCPVSAEGNPWEEVDWGSSSNRLDEQLDCLENTLVSAGVPAIEPANGNPNKEEISTPEGNKAD